MRGGARLMPKAVRFHRAILVRDDGAKQLATEVIVQAVNDVRLGVHNGWLTADGQPVNTPIPKAGNAREQWKFTRRVLGRIFAAEAAAFLRDAQELGYWLGLCESDITASEYAAAVFRQMRKEHP